MIKSAATLKRWIAATGGDLPYPSSPDQIGMDLALKLQLQMAEPELLQILQGNAPARLELAVMEGTLADVAPTQQERADAATAARIEELTATNPYGSLGVYQGDEYIPGAQGNLTAVLELEALNPDLAARLKAEAQPAQPAHHFTEGEVRILAQHGYAVPQS